MNIESLTNLTRLMITTKKIPLLFPKWNKMLQYFKKLKQCKKNVLGAKDSGFY